MAKIKSIDHQDLSGKRVLVRYDLNVPLGSDGEVSDTSRADSALDSIKNILSQGPKKLVLMSHLGRPKGEYNPKFSLAPVAQYLAEKLDQEVTLTERPDDKNVKSLLELPDVKIVLIENLRFHKGEEANSDEFAQMLARYGDVYVNEAFGAAHRKHASVHAILKYFPVEHYAGTLMLRELQSLKKITESPERRFVAVLGGAKVSDKIGTIEKLITQVDALVIGGAMAYPFLKAKGTEVGSSLCAEEEVSLAKKILKSESASKILLPVDHVVANGPDGDPLNTTTSSIPEGKMGLDIGERTIRNFEEVFSGAKTIFWNGPMGLFEKEAFSHGTMEIAKLIAQSGAFSLVGGGDSVSAARKSGYAEHFSHLSTGGGASLEFIEQGDLVGLRALKVGVS